MISLKLVREILSFANSKYGAPLIFFVLIIVAWQIGSDCNLLLLVPSPVDVAKTFGAYYHIILRNTWATLFETIAGFGVAVFLGTIFAAGVTYSDFVKNAVYPVLVILQVVPKMALAPLFLIWFGLGYEPKIVLTFLISFFPITVNGVLGFTDIEPEILDLVHSLRATEWEIFTKIRFQNALPYLFSAFRISICFSLVGAVVGEFLGAKEGLGYLIIRASHEVWIAQILAVMLVLAVIGVLLFKLVDISERYLLPWRVAEK